MLHGTKAECFFLDVGQGSSHIITLGRGRAIVIDTGPADTYKILLQTLENLRIHTLEVVVFSHNDNDHIGNATNLLLKYSKHIRNLFLVRDRDIRKTFYYRNLLRCMVEMTSDGRLDRKSIHDLVPERGKFTDVLFREIDSTGAEIALKLIYPTVMWDSVQAQMDDIPNDTCAVLLFSVGESKIVFSGDAPLKAWKQMRSSGQIFPLEAEIATVPHHGGSLGCDDIEGKEFYTTTLCPKVGIISVASHNKHKHPLPYNIQNLVESGVNVLCTEMTPQCTEVSYRENPLRFRPPVLSLSSHHKKSIPCSGTIVVDIAPQGIEIKHHERYQRWKEQYPNRLCKPQQNFLHNG